MKHNLLIVDDDSDILEFLEFLIETQLTNCRLFTASTGEMAMDILEKHKISMIILDVFLPDVDGYVLCRQIKQNPKTNHIPIHLCSAKFTSPLEKVDENTGADGLISKPFDNQDFIERINRVLSSS